MQRAMGKGKKQGRSLELVHAKSEGIGARKEFIASPCKEQGAKGKEGVHI